MIPPSDLDKHGLRAFDVAAERVSDAADVDNYYDAVVRFARAVQMVEKVRAEWIAEGEPLLFEHSNKSLVPHPLVKLLAESEKEAARAGRALKLEPSAVKSPRGRKAGDNLSADRSKRKVELL